jgi:two-component system, sensor histidine kinase YesM
MNLIANVKTRLLSLPYRAKLIFVFSLLIVMTALILGSITYYHFASSSQQRTKEYQIQLADQINRNIDRYIKEMQIISLSPLYDQEVLNILKDHVTMSSTTSFPPAHERVKIWRYISSLIHGRNEIKGIHILANDGTIFSNLDSNTVLLKAFDTQNDWIQKIKSADGEKVIIPLHHPNYYLDKDVAAFSIGRLIREPTNLQSLGIIKIDLKEDLIEDVIRNTHSKSLTFILDKENKFIYSNKNEKIIDDSFLKEVENIKVKNYSNVPINGTDYMMVFNDSAYSGLKVIMLTPRSEIFKEVNNLRILLFWVVMLGVITCVILAFVLSKPLVGSIHKLQKAMIEIEKGNLSKRVMIQSDDEIGQLGQGFNHMINEIDRLVSEVYKTSLREKEAEIRALQSQMNPHFLYNTLESINMLAITKENLDVSDMVTALGKLLRYTIDNSSKVVRLQDELSFIQSYISIQQVRMGKLLKYSEDIEQSLFQVLIPKLILQPLVENSIVHGISNQGGSVHIKVSNVKSKLHIELSDNGKGVSTETLKKLKQSLKNIHNTSSDQHNGIALSNINERIQLLYGKQFGINIESELTKGFLVKMVLPIIKKGDKNHEGNINSRR